MTPPDCQAGAWVPAFAGMTVGAGMTEWRAGMMMRRGGSAKWGAGMAMFGRAGMAMFGRAGMAMFGGAGMAMFGRVVRAMRAHGYGAAEGGAGLMA